MCCGGQLTVPFHLGKGQEPSWGMCHSHLCQGTFPSWVTPRGSCLHLADVTLEQGPIPATDFMQEFHPLLTQAASYKQGRAALQSDINRKVCEVLSSSGASCGKKAVDGEEQQCLGHPFSKVCKMCLQKGCSQSPRGWELLLTVTGTNSRGSGEGPISWWI